MTLAKCHLGNKLVGLCHFILIDYRAVEPRNQPFSPISCVVTIGSRTVADGCKVTNFPNIPMCRNFAEPGEARFTEGDVWVEAACHDATSFSSLMISSSACFSFASISSSGRGGVYL